MKKFFEPMWYPWDTMMYYMGYNQDDSDYEYESYAANHYRSATNSVSDYMPWEAIEEVGDSHKPRSQLLNFIMYGSTFFIATCHSWSQGDTNWSP